MLLDTHAANLSGLDFFEDLSQFRRERQEELKLVPPSHQDDDRYCKS